MQASGKRRRGRARLEEEGRRNGQGHIHTVKVRDHGVSMTGDESDVGLPRVLGKCVKSSNQCSKRCLV